MTTNSPSEVPGGPYPGPTGGCHFRETGGRALLITPGQGIVVLIPDPPGAQVYEVEHAEAIAYEILRAAAKARQALVLWTFAQSLPTTTDDLSTWLKRHHLSETPSAGLVLAAVQADLARWMAESAGRPPSDLDQLILERQQDPAFRAGYDDTVERETLLKTLVDRRTSLNLSQADVAERMGTTQSAVSDLERGATDPRLSTLQRYARAVASKLRVIVQIEN